MYKASPEVLSVTVPERLYPSWLLLARALDAVSPASSSTVAAMMRLMSGIGYSASLMQRTLAPP